MSEIWKPVPGWRGLYEVSSFGRVRSIAREVMTKRGFKQKVPGRVLRPGIARGYERVVLQKGGMRHDVAVHRLVLETFVGPCPDGMEACHGDDNRRNNLLMNLRWDTKSANCQDRTRNGGCAQTRKTHCPQGHPYSPENTYTYGKSRKCRTCHIRRTVARKRARRITKEIAP